MSDPRSPELQAEIQRVLRRWRELPLERALSHSPQLHSFVDAVASETRGVATRLPQLGPAVLADQFVVVLYDAAAAGIPELTDRVAQLRRDLG